MSRDLGSQERGARRRSSTTAQLQRMLYDAGLAGICVPEEYGGRGLTLEHQQVLNEEIAGFEYPMRFQAPDAVPVHGGHPRLRHRGAEATATSRRSCSGEALWAQFLSEPSGGSDVAGALTTAIRDGDEWVLNGSKVWTTGCVVVRLGPVPGAYRLGRAEAPRASPCSCSRSTSPASRYARIEMLNGSNEFCEEFLTDVRVPDTDRLGEVERRLDGRHPLDVPRAHVDELAVRHPARRATGVRRRRERHRRGRPVRRPAPRRASPRSRRREFETPEDGRGPPQRAHRTGRRDAARCRTRRRRSVVCSTA